MHAFNPHGSDPVNLFPENLTVQLTNRFYSKNTSATLRADRAEATFNVSGLSTLKTNVRVSNWDFTDKNRNDKGLALQWSVSQSGVHESRIGGEKVNFRRNIQNGSEKAIGPPKGKPQVSVNFNAGNKAIAAFKAPPVVKLREGTDERLANSSFSYRTSNGQLMMFMSAPAADEILYDPFIQIVRDTSSPTLSMKTTPQGEEVNQKEITISWIGRDEVSYISHYEVKIDKEEWKDVGKNTTFTFEGLSEGEHTIEVKALDIVGNDEILSINFTVRLVNYFRVSLYGIIFTSLFGILFTATIFHYLRGKGAF